ncbi:hypothetical protein EDD68_13015 [Melghiribacillus thermohalophilus]|uniref:Hydrolase n=1 Tax=Melghiribacillus thermohalophilus TaxID=1324956 RepID=A0A4R3MS10_9BACI|nr:hydrolase [Melghiribacillus thermohalophilus]TCT17521.1 hypothetical protein EDD68_13015 [Melghiribacillus thermohalophilus]
MEKTKFYVNLGTQEISRLKAGNNEDFIIYATPDEIRELRELFNNMYDSDLGAFVRSHIPILEYHHDRPNDHYDEGMLRVLEKLYELGDMTTKKHIESMGVIDNQET